MQSVFRAWLTATALVTGCSLSLPVHAEDAPSDWSLLFGNMLPNQIDGISEILPVFGLRYGYGLDANNVIEVGVSNSHAEGVDFTTFSAGLRADLPAIESFIGFVGVGADYNYYRKINTEDRTSEIGLHVASGLFIQATETLWLRTELRFAAGPGTSLSILAGLTFRSGAGG